MLKRIAIVAVCLMSINICSATEYYCDYSVPEYEKHYKDIKFDPEVDVVKYCEKEAASPNAIDYVNCDNKYMRLRAAYDNDNCVPVETKVHEGENSKCTVTFYKRKDGIYKLKGFACTGSDAAFHKSIRDLYRNE